MTPQEGAPVAESDPINETETFDSRATGRLSALRVEPPAERSSISGRNSYAAWMIPAYAVAASAAVLIFDAYIDPIAGAAIVAASTLALWGLHVFHRRQLRDIEYQVHSRDSHIGRIIDTMANGVALVDLDGTIVEVNPALVSMLGYSRQELIGRALAPVESSNGQRVTPTSMVLEYARKNGRWSGELQRNHADGHRVPIHLTLAPLYDDDEQLVGYVGDYLDLRDIKTAEEHLDGLGAVIEQLATEIDLEVVGDKAVGAAVDLTDGDFGNVVLLDDEYGRLEHRWLHDFPDDIDAAGPADAPGLAARIIEEPTPKVIDDLASAPVRFGLYEEIDATSLAAVPIDVRGVTRGALVVATEAHEDFGESQVSLLEAVARQLGVALHRHDLLEEARQSEARFRNVVNSVPDVLYSATLPDFRTSYMSPSVEPLLGLEPDEFMAQPKLWRDLIHDDDFDGVQRQLDTILDSQDDYAVEYRIENRERSEWHWVEDRGRVQRDDDGQPRSITGVISDITARKEAEDRLAYLAFNDKLTGLPNRLGFLEQLDGLYDAEAPVTGILLYCDLDRFHLVNDIHGHESGNQLLIETARRLEDIVPDNGLVCRMGADEFVAFLPVDASDSTADSDSEALRTTLEDRARGHALEIMESFREPYTIRDQPSYLSTTIGIGLANDDVDDPRTLIKNAHRALAYAKETGPANFAFYAGELARRQQRRLSLQSQIHRGLNNDEFQLFYQPIVDLQSGAIIGAEALLRWTTSDGESISPGEFIPVAEESGLIIPLGDWVVEQACKDLRRWLDDGLDIQISLNLSPRQFYQLDIVERIESSVRNTDLAPARFELELTESDILVDPDETTQILGRLRSAGFSIAIDDFGTGYSSLERLKTLPVETLKIDRSFVSDLPTCCDDTSIVDTVVTLSDNFEMTSLAEGIETREQWELLRDMGCAYGQGYYFSRPVCAERFRKLCAAPPWTALPAQTTG